MPAQTKIHETAGTPHLRPKATYGLRRRCVGRGSDHSLLEFVDGGVRGCMESLRSRATPGVRRAHGPRVAGGAHVLGIAHRAWRGVAVSRAARTLEAVVASFSVRFAPSRSLRAHHARASWLPGGGAREGERNLPREAARDRGARQ